jgi:hypothetical protein
VELNPLNRVLMDVWLPLLLVTAAFLPLVFAHLVWRRNEYLGFLMLGMPWVSPDWTRWCGSGRGSKRFPPLCSPVKICFYFHIWWTMEKEKDLETTELRKTQRTRFRLLAPLWASGVSKVKLLKLSSFIR